jgi:hypothetical protein
MESCHRRFRPRVDSAAALEQLLHMIHDMHLSRTVYEDHVIRYFQRAKKREHKEQVVESAKILAQLTNLGEAPTTRTASRSRSRFVTLNVKKSCSASRSSMSKGKDRPVKE